MPNLANRRPEINHATIGGPGTRPRFDAAGTNTDTEFGALARSAPQRLPPNIETEDWEGLFRAVQARLGPGAGELECVAALGQLRASMTQQIGRRQALEMELFGAQTALAQMRADLAGTRAGERLARHLALHDGLTLLPNRSHFHQRLDAALASALPPRKALAVLYIDLDGFKAINDGHGHDAGDELLKIVAKRLARAVRRGDMVGRLGGDEFACLLADLPGRQRLCQLACKLFDAVSAPVRIGPLELSVRPSIGIAICPTDGATTKELLNASDAAMYQAKQHQTGYAFFDQRSAAG